ncbi:hypothetical protein LJ737_20845 [Hymenobacter sp. 15J16-1T3B]|uniref:hypothetical protein n=1 Tax=Hymenobacter sp. 15J16-1T3B TaxID=2886941 RepID=UPI001D1021D1|nr:hypothetical protein [Hymenobacter sp. 15J16-1T3B]MCC3159702.1 hypothetical protein [Hymenobacter sp. 15J16-1T3B]
MPNPVFATYLGESRPNWCQHGHQYWVNVWTGALYPYAVQAVDFPDEEVEYISEEQLRRNWQADPADPRNIQ